MDDSLVRPVDPGTLPEPAGAYAHGALVTGHRRTLFVSGQVPWSRHGDVPRDFAAQCRLTWDNVLSVLAGAGMGPGNLVKVTTYLADRAHLEENSRIRREVLGGHRPAVTIVITGIYDEEWLLEIEAVAVE